jgi:hypothetical protein
MPPFRTWAASDGMPKHEVVTCRPERRQFRHLIIAVIDLSFR